MKHTEKLIPIAIAVVLAGGIGFYGGTKYGPQNQPAPQTGGGPNGQNPGGGPGRGAGGRGMGNGGFVGGEILSKDTESVTLKMRDGGSKIILIAPTTQVLKSTSGSVGDLTVGEQITVVGTANPDGSVSAQSLQIRPSMPAGAAPTAPRN